MAGNVLTGRIKQIDTTAGSAVTGQRRIRLIQWIDAAMDVVDGDDFVIVLGGITFTTKAKIGDDTGQQSIVLWQMGPFNPGFRVDGYSVSTLTHGVVYIFED